jgi:hypothetical protein
MYLPFKFQRSTPNKVIDIFGTTAADFPIYTIDGIYIDSPEYDSSGAFILNLKKKLVNANVNFTSGNKL